MKKKPGKKTTKGECTAKKVMSSCKFLHNFVTQFSLLRFSWRSDNIIARIKENTFKGLSVYPR